MTNLSPADVSQIKARSPGYAPEIPYLTEALRARSSQRPEIRVDDANTQPSHTAKKNSRNQLFGSVVSIKLVCLCITCCYTDLVLPVVIDRIRAKMSGNAHLLVFYVKC
jgi:hypothetical protein